MSYQRLLIELGMLIFFKNVSLTDSMFRFSALFLDIAVIVALCDSFGWKSSKESFNNTGVHKSPFLVLLYIIDFPDDLASHLRQ